MNDPDRPPQTEQSPDTITTPEQRKFNQYEVVERLKRDGIQNPEAKEYLLGWIDQEQAAVDKIGTSKATLEFNIVWAKVYRDAGLIEDAREAFMQASEQAYQERDEVLYNQIEDEMDKLK